MDSPFVHVFDTNYTPSDDELKQIKQILIEPTIQRDELGAEILRLQAKRDWLNDFIIPHLSLLSPIRRIPQDILQEIFLWCLPTTYNSIMSWREAPLLLGRVCSSWRSISMTTPKLWSSLHIATPVSFIGHELGAGEGFTQAIVDWLNRSGTLPLSISIHQGVGSTETLKGNLAQHIRPFANRWKHIVLFLRHTEFAAFADISATEVPLLESLSMQFHVGRGWRPRWFTEPCGMLQAPRLRGLMICSSLVSNVSTSWSQLTQLIITGLAEDGLGVGIVLAVMMRCENLVSCDVTFPSRDRFLLPEGDAPVVAMVSPLLKTLSVKGGNSLGLGIFFDHLHLSALLDLTLHSKHAEHTIFQSLPFHAFLRRSTTLDRLSITAHTLSREYLIQCIAETPHITKLHLDIWREYPFITPTEYPFITSTDYPVDDHLLGLLTPATDRTLPFPEEYRVQRH